MWDESAALYEHSLKLWEGLAQELNYNLMFSQRGVLNLIHNVHDLQEATRRVNANRLNAVDGELLVDGRGQGLLPDPQHLDGHALPDFGRHLAAAGRQCAP